MQGIVQTAHIKNITLAILSALLLSLSFPVYDLELLAWTGLIPLFFLIKGNSSKNTFFWCWASGTLFFFVTTNWITKTMYNYGGIPAWLSFIILLFLSIYLGLYLGLFGFLTSFITRRIAIPIPFVAPALWVSLEYARAHLLTGFPWSSLGYTQYKFLSIIQIADMTSVFGISFLIVCVNAALFEIYLITRGRHARSSAYSIASIFFIALVFLSSLLYGHYRLQAVYDNPDNALDVAVIQGNIPQHLKWNRDLQRRTIDIYENLTREAGKDALDLAIWPETAAPLFFQDKSVYQKDIYDLAMKEEIYLLFGSPAYASRDDGSLRLFNRAYLISPAGDILSKYDKIHLVPFGEYVPLSKILFFIEKMVVGIGDFIPGSDYTVMQIPKGKFGVVICYEVIFPDLVRRFALNGAEFMTTITNDAWFGISAGPYQHFAMVTFRAVENRVYFARAANTGISGFINPKGEILEASPLFVKSFHVQKISPSITRTFYTSYGDVFAYASIFLTCIIFLIAVRKGFKDSRIQGGK